MIRMLFNLPSLAYFMIAPGVLFLFGIVSWQAMGDDAERLKALKHAPPTMVPLENFDLARNKGDYSEVAVRAQLDVERIIDITKTKNGEEKGRTLVAPLYTTVAKDRAEGLRAVMVYDGVVTDQQLGSMAIARGAFGPIIAIDGVITDDFSLRKDALSALERSGGMPTGTMIIKPFVHGREAELKPREMTIPLLITGLVLASVIAIYGYFRRRSEREELDGRYA
jgi:hypothetical protein